MSFLLCTLKERYLIVLIPHMTALHINIAPSPLEISDMYCWGDAVRLEVNSFNYNSTLCFCGCYRL